MSTEHIASRIEEGAVREIAARADADERTVWKRIAGGDVRGRVARRIDAAITAWRTENSPATSAA
jgi:hypothetical protein